jgi:glycosyltransferase involved in cell wall biosynthesis
MLEDAIRSAYAQTLPPVEVVVVNDGSTDDTAQLLDRISKDLPSSFVYETKPNGGEASARNRGVDLSRGEFVAFLDQDDRWLPSKLERQMALFADDPAPALTFTAYTRISERSREVVALDHWNPDPEAVLRELMIGSCVTPSTVIVRRSALDAVERFDESLWLGCDWTMWLRLAAAGYRMVYLPEPLTEYAWHETNMSQDQRRIADAALVIFDRLFASGSLPPSIQRRQRWCMARWHLISAISQLQADDRAAGRRHLLEAIRTHPTSIRPGWLRLLWKSLPVPAS